MVIEARFLTTSDTLIVDEIEYPIYEIDKDAIWEPTNCPRVAVFLEACTDNATLFKPYEYVTVK